MTTTASPTLFFGKHKGQPLDAIPSDYLLWVMREVRLTSRMQAAVAAELVKRGLAPPEPLPRSTPWLGPCRRCGCPHVAYRWHEHSNGQRQIRASCPRCGGAMGIAPKQEPYIGYADKAASTAPVLDVLIALEGLGIEVRSDGRSAWIDYADHGRVPAELLHRLRECQHTLAGLIGRGHP